jgi:hypothetical protein
LWETSFITNITTYKKRINTRATYARKLQHPAIQ